MEINIGKVIAMLLIWQSSLQIKDARCQWMTVGLEGKGGDG